MKHNPKILKYIRDIAKLHNVKISFKSKESGGWYFKGIIDVGTNNSTNELISVFCHELGHHKNWIESKYKDYHNLSHRQFLKKYGLYKSAIMGLEAEIYTEKVGKELCAIWFPGVKYRTEYKNNMYCLGYMVGFFSK